jgi:hypothetical protein
MADYAAPVTHDEPSASAVWALGFLFFATPVLVMAGLFQGFQGLAAIIKGGFFVAPPNYAFHLPPTVWGWFHLLFGLVMATTGVLLALGRPWARPLAIIVALVSAVLNFFFLPYYPVWAVIVIGLDVVVIWAVASHGREIDKFMS